MNKDDAMEIFEIVREIMYIHREQNFDWRRDDEFERNKELERFKEFIDKRYALNDGRKR